MTKPNFLSSLFCSMMLCLCCPSHVSAQQLKDRSKLPVMETGGQIMPDEWIDKDTGHRVFKLTRRDGANRSFYFHNNPFVGDEMLFVGSTEKVSSTDQRAGNGTTDNHKQMYAVNLKTLKIRQVTHQPYNVSTEIVCSATRELFFQHNDSIFACSIDNGKTRLIARLPKGKTGHIVCVNCNGTQIAGTFENPEEGRIVQEHPKKAEFFDLIFRAKLEKTIFCIDTKTGEFTDVWTDHAWLNHLQFSPIDPYRLLFCHEGHWHKVDRIWNIDIRTHKPVLMHKRTVFREIAGHEWFGALGQYIYFDLQKPRSETFYVGQVDVNNLHETIFPLTRDTWSVHYTTAWDESFIVGDGGAPHSVANSDKDQWIFRYDFAKTHKYWGHDRPDSKDSTYTIVADTMNITKLVNMKHHNYGLEPNVHFSPDNRFIIFRANFEGYDNVYAVEL